MPRPHGPWTVLDSAVVYENPWIRVRHDVVRTPAGEDGVYGVVETKPAVAVVAMAEDGDTFLIGQFRYPHGEYSWEVPEGAAESGEDLVYAAARELSEEAGLVAQKWTALGTVATSNCIMDETAYIYLAEDLRIGEPSPDPTEQLEMKRLPLSEALAMADDGRIQDALSIVSLYRAAAHLEVRSSD